MRREEALIALRGLAAEYAADLEADPSAAYQEVKADDADERCFGLSSLYWEEWAGIYHLKMDFFRETNMPSRRREIILEQARAALPYISGLHKLNMEAFRSFYVAAGSNSETGVKVFCKVMPQMLKMDLISFIETVEIPADAA